MGRNVVIAGLLSLSAFACVPQGEMEPGSGGSTGGSAGGKTGGTGGGRTGGSGGSDSSGGSGGGNGGAASGGSGGGGGGTGGSPSPDGGMGADTTNAMGDCTSAQPESLFCKPLGKMPMSIKGTGLFPSLPDFSKHANSLIEFRPSPELWSDGMGKQRFILLPQGKKIDNAERERWNFPVGTIFVKTFFDDAAAGKARPIETRFIRRIGDLTMGAFSEYDYHVYQWNAEGTDASLVITDDTDEMKSIPVPITINRMVEGKPLVINEGKPFMHDLPSRQMCKGCHEESGMEGGQTFIGFDELRLNTKLTAASAKTQLQEFHDRGVFTKAMPTDPVTIVDADPRLLRIKRAIFGNCVHCHMGNKVFDLRPNVFVENNVKKPTEAQSVKPPAGWLRVVPGSPDTSVLYRQMLRTGLPAPMGDADRLRPMPPFGVADYAPTKSAVDQAVLDDVRAWIMSLPK